MSKRKNNFKARVLQVVSRIPKGKILTYKEVARRAGNEKASRGVGAMMHINVNPRVPCHRVVGSNGWIGGYRGGTRRKIAILKKEGVDVSSFRLK